MGRIVYFMHTSVDGFVGGPAGEMDWIKINEDMFEYAGAQTDRSGTALYGRVTYDMMEGYWPKAGDMPNASKHDKVHSAWYNKVPKVVLSRTLKGANIRNTKIINDNFYDEIHKLKKETDSDIVIFGSPSVGHLLMAENLIDDYWLFVNPILLGKGIPLFKDINARSALKLMESHTFPNGVVCLHYEKAN